MLKRYFVALLAYCICLLDVSVCLCAVEPQILSPIYCLIAIAYCFVFSYSYLYRLQKLTTLICLTLSNLNRFSHFDTAGKCRKFATKIIWRYPPHLRHVATLPWKIFLKIKFSADIQQIWKKMQTESAPMNTRLPWYLTGSPVGLRLVLLAQD